VRTSLLTLLCSCALSSLFSLAATAQIPLSLTATTDRNQSAEVKIEEALAKELPISFVDTPLRDVMAHISERSGVGIRLSKKIEDAGIQPDQPVTLQLRNISLNSSLNILLKDLNLTTMIQNELLVITTVEDAHSPENMLTHIYPVKDLLAERNDFDPIIELITSTIEPDSWQDVGGPGAVSGFDNPPVLVVSSRRDIHQQVGALLMTLRRAKSLPGIASVNSLPPKASSRFPIAASRAGSRSTRRPRDAASPNWLLPQTYEAKE